MAWRRRPRRLTRRRERPVLRGGEGGSIGVVWLVSSTRWRPDLVCTCALLSPPSLPRRPLRTTHCHPRLHHGSWRRRRHWPARWGRRQQRQSRRHLRATARPSTLRARSRRMWLSSGSARGHSSRASMFWWKSYLLSVRCVTCLCLGTSIYCLFSDCGYVWLQKLSPLTTIVMLPSRWLQLFWSQKE